MENNQKLPKKNHATVKRDKLLIGVDEIIEYLNLSRRTLYKFIADGLPVQIFYSRYYAHKDRLDSWFYFRATGTKTIDDDAE